MKRVKRKGNDAVLNENSRIFSICKGVFQGGGCRGIAYVGVYEELLSHGISFSEVYGTSAGAIVSALIAAGATPEEMKSWLASLDVHKIQNRSLLFKSLYLLFNSIPKYVCRMFGKEMKGISRFWVEIIHIIKHGSIYDSSLLQSEIENELKKLTGIQDRLVMFSDLRIPLRIVCSDLMKSEAKVFGLSKNEETPVSQAVVCSAAVPLYFSVLKGRYCDGCIVSNLPVYTVRNNGYFDRILAFTLSDNDGSKLNTKNALSIIKKAFSTITSAGVKIQMNAKPNCYRINIDCTGYDLLDFPNLQNEDWRNKLIDKGRCAVRKFLHDHHPIIMKNDIYESQSQFTAYTQIAQLCNERYSEIVVSYKTTEWCWDLFPLVWKWCLERTKVTVFCWPINDNLIDEKARRRLLVHFGCEIRVMKKLPMTGYFFNKNKDNWQGVTIHGKDGQQMSHFYNREEDRFYLQSSIEKLIEMSTLEKQSMTSGDFKISLTRICPDSLFDMLSPISFYKNATFSLEEINPSDLYIMSQYVAHHKYLNVSQLNRMYDIVNCEYYEPAELNIANGKKSIVVPPVCELRGGQLVVIDGKARCYYAYRHRIKSLKIIVVRNVTERLPSKNLYSIKDAVITDVNLSIRNSKFEFDYAYYRPIEPTIHPSGTYLLV